MDDTTSEATSPYSASEMEYSSMYNQSNHTYQFHSQQQMNEGMTHSQATQDQLLQGDALRKPRSGCRRPKLSEDERREHIRQYNVNYRLRKKGKVNEMTAQNQYLQYKFGQLSTENRQLKEETGRLSSENRHLKEETGQLSTENRHLKEETRRLYHENKHLDERIRGLRSKGQLPADALQRQDSYISLPTSQVDQQNVYVQDQYGMESNNDDHVYSNHHCMGYSLNEGAANGFDGLEINDLQNLLFSENEMTPNGRVANNDVATEDPEGSQSGLCPAEVAKIKFLMELDAEVTSNIDPSNFTDLEGEQRRVGRFSFPLSLIPTVERINNVYGDVSATSLISPSISGTIYVLFCATIREMEHLQLEQINEDIMLKWRDVIKDALRLSFNVTFALEHLKKIACAYFGLPGCLLLHGIDSKISTVEAVVNDWKKERAKIYEEFKMSIDATEKFIGLPVSTGLFP